MPESRLWASGDAYEPFVGRWSRLVAVRFLDWLDVPDGASWLDVGCGTGALTEAIVERTSPSAVLGVDPSEHFVSYARERVPDPAEFAIGGAEQLPVEDRSFDAVVSGLVLNFVPDPARGLAEMVRAAKPGGLVAAYVWDYGDKMQLMRHFWDAAGELSDAAREHDEAARFPICKPGPLRALAHDAGLLDADLVPIDVDTVFRDFDDYWSPFLGGGAPAPAYAMSLTPAEREQLRGRIRSRLRDEPDGSIRLIARAWALKGYKKQRPSPR